MNLPLAHILHYPTIEFPSDTWVKATLCLWDRIYRIVPPSYHPQDSDAVKRAIDAGLIESIVLTKEDLAEAADQFEIFWDSVPMLPSGISGYETVNLYEEKIDQRILPLMRSLSDKFPEDGLLNVSKEVADTYVLFLAEIVSRRRQMQKLTDDPDMFALMHYFANDGNINDYHCNVEGLEASIAITMPAVVPVGLEDASMEQIISLRGKFGPQRIAFRNSVSDLIAKVSTIEDEGHTRAVIADFEESLAAANTSWVSRLKNEAINAAYSGMSVGLPAAITALGTLISAGSYMKSSPTILGTIAVGCVATLADAARTRRGQWTPADAFFYAKMRQTFQNTSNWTPSPPPYDRSIEEFIND